MNPGAPLDYLALRAQMDPPYTMFDNTLLGPEFAQELRTVSRLWFRCGYRPGISAYLNFFLLKDFIVLHDDAAPPRFRSFKSMADSFYQTDLFIRDVTDSGPKATGGISSADVRRVLMTMMARHQAVSIPLWMMTYFGFSLLENVEKQCPDATLQEKQWHLQYMSKTYRLMGMPFSSDRLRMEAFARQVESACAEPSPALEKHARNILILGEMAGVPHGSVASFLPEATRRIFQRIYERVRPSPVLRIGARLAGRLLMKQAIGAPREAVPIVPY